MLTPLLKIMHRLRNPKPAQTSGIRYPYNLTPEHYARLDAFSSSAYYPDFLALLDIIANLATEDLLISSNNEKLQFLRGYVTGLRKAGTLIPEITFEVARETNDGNKRTTAAAGRDAARSRISTFGTGWWEPDRDGV